MTVWNYKGNMRIEFSVDITPRPQPRPRFTYIHKRAYEPKYIKVYKDTIGLFARLHMGNRAPLTGLVKIEITVRRNKRLGTQIFGDIDNHIKSVLDALNGICYKDDALVVKLVAEKEDDKREGIDVVVTDEL